MLNVEFVNAQKLKWFLTVNIHNILVQMERLFPEEIETWDVSTVKYVTNSVCTCDFRPITLHFRTVTCDNPLCRPITSLVRAETNDNSSLLFVPGACSFLRTTPQQSGPFGTVFGYGDMERSGARPSQEVHQGVLLRRTPVCRQQRRVQVRAGQRYW